MCFEELSESIWRLKVPFEDIYTAVFLLKNDGKSILFDTATTESDCTQYILPALSELGTVPDYLVCSHLHEDHAGGLPKLAEAFPTARIAVFSKSFSFKDRHIRRLEDGELLLDRYRVLNLKGHTDDSIALFDVQNRVLLTADCLQLYGVSRYGTGIGEPQEYPHSLQRVRTLGVEMLVTSHEYVPLGSTAIGKEQIEAYLNVCEEAFHLLEQTICESNLREPNELALYYQEKHPSLPPVDGWVFDGFLKKTQVLRSGKETIDQ